MFFFNAHPTIVITILAAVLCSYAVAAAANANRKLSKTLNYGAAALAGVGTILLAVWSVLKPTPAIPYSIIFIIALEAIVCVYAIAAAAKAKRKVTAIANIACAILMAVCAIMNLIFNV